MKEKIEKLLEIIYESYDNEITKMVNMMILIDSRFSAITDDLTEIVKKSLNFEKIKPGLIEIYSEYLNEDDIDVIINFYLSESGKKFLENQENIAQRAKILSEEKLAENKDEIDKSLKELLSKRAKDN